MKLSIGPGALVAAAFIGPGTVTACTLAGANFGFALLWALVFATFATMILQTMSARLGVGARLGLGEALMAGAGKTPVRYVIAGLVLAALGLGNAAYEGGNLSGGALGAEALLGDLNEDEFKAVVLALSALAAALLMLGGYKLIEKALVSVVILMALAFLVAAVLVQPDLGAMVKGLVPSIPESGLFTAIALIGTTIVPYNLFLHAASARKRWTETSDVAVSEAQSDTVISVGLGGLISIFVLTTAAASLFGTGSEISNALDMAAAIEPTYGQFARWLVGVGLLAAGLSSAITAPMATAFAVTELFKSDDPRIQESVFKGVALITLLIGTGLAISGIRPTDVIFIAQIANGLLLPIIAASLLYAMNRKSLLGDRVNGLLSNILGVGVVLITLLMGIRGIGRAVGFWP
ncbi:Nramp family divalent metal transporter [Ponticaulis sp.]|uniref:Nramp family divalent metal transporter n=1 Tax=Ponticaulis sp. TaxID=2020902 RepID=UPI0026372AA5|nr:Nramp family divalent metal transporter [Ponticaulis sp.]MDF1681591.1 Nramp family divalent metal transporter [Ponticaulis sp.]